MKFDSTRAIDLTDSTKRGKGPLFGYVGPFPSRPCDVCGCETFYPGDWNLGYSCTDGWHVFGTKEEWDYERGR